MSNIQPIVPTNIAEAWEQAKYYYSVSFIKQNFDSASDVFFVINLGLELGLTPAQSIQNIAIIKGKATIWGDLMPAVIHSSGLLEKLTETIEGDLDGGTAKAVCTIKRKGFDETVFEFSTDDATRAGLWKYKTTNPKHKYLPWATYPLRMLKIRARTFALRDIFPDLLKGLISKEEAEDYVTIDPKDITEVKQPKMIDETKKIEQVMVKAIPPKTKNPQFMTSILLGEKYIISVKDGAVHFESGIIYSPDEIKKSQDMNDAEKKKYHLDKLEKESGNTNLYKEAQNLQDIAEV